MEEIIRKPIKIQHIIKEALKLLRASIPVTIEIRQEIDPQCGTVLADPTQMHQVLMNLCTNAYHAMREKGGILGVSLVPIEISKDDRKVASLMLAPGSYLKLEVSDTGCGMDRAILERIFDPYFTTKKTGEGTGMGLAVTHGIITNHGGIITVDSKPGKGTSFNIFLPQLKYGSVDFETESSISLPRGNEQIMFVDDERAIVQMGKQMLANLGYRVEVFTNSREALDAFQERSGDYDLVITDMTMPNMTGADLALNLMSIKPDIPIILCSGFSELIDKDRAKAIGIREYIMKPITIRGLAKVVRNVLDGKV